MNEQTQPEKVPLGELYRKSETDQEELDEQLSQEPSRPPKKPSRLEKLERQKSQIEAKMKAIHARENEKTRRERTRRLIQIGALSEKYLNCEGMEPKEYEALLQQLVTMPEVKAILKRD